MTNTGGSSNQVASGNPQSSTSASPPAPPPPASQSPATPASRTPANPITAPSTEISTSFSARAGGSSTASTRIIINPSASVGVGSSRCDVPPRKRGSMLAAGEGSSGGRAGEGDQPRNVRPNAPPPEPVVLVEQRLCSVCQKVFGSAKALFGHMNCHPDRGWKGAYPPPTFNREEFADLHAQMEPNMEVVDDAPVLPDFNISEPAAEERRYQLPDLNLPPPREEE